MIYKVSYVIDDEESPGIIRVRDTQPCIGDLVIIDGNQFIVSDVAEVSRRSPNIVYMLAKVDARSTETQSH